MQFPRFGIRLPGLGFKHESPTRNKAIIDSLEESLETLIPIVEMYPFGHRKGNAHIVWSAILGNLGFDPVGTAKLNVVGKLRRALPFHGMGRNGQWAEHVRARVWEVVHEVLLPRDISG